jgi:ribosomal protein S28E/S33
VIDGSTQKYPVLNAAPTFAAPPVQAALVFAAEPFSYVAGVGTRDEVENISGLNAEFVTYADGRGPIELPYADGYRATEKASAIAASLLNGQFTYDLGGYVVQGINGTQLSPVIDRVTVRWSENGAVEEVDFTTERDRNVAAAGPNSYVLQVPPERDFERRAQLLQLLPGQRELKEEARQLRLIAASLQQNPRIARTILEAFTMAFGLDAMPASVYVDPAFEYSVALPAGTPMYREADSRLSLAHGDAVEALNPVFQGVTVFDGEKSDGPVRVTATGDNGTIYARVKGPVKVNDAVGLADSVQTYLETGNKVSLTVGNVLEEITGAETRLAPVRVTGAGGSGGEVLPVWL